MMVSCGLTINFLVAFLSLNPITKTYKNIRFVIHLGSKKMQQTGPGRGFRPPGYRWCFEGHPGDLGNKPVSWLKFADLLIHPLFQPTGYSDSRELCQETKAVDANMCVVHSHLGRYPPQKDTKVMTAPEHKAALVNQRWLLIVSSNYMVDLCRHLWLIMMIQDG